MAETPLRYLDAGGMLAISGALLGDLRSSLTSIAHAKPFLDDIQEVHTALLAARPAEPPDDAAAQAAMLEGRAADVRHDHVLRALYYGHRAHIEHLLSLDPPDEDAAAEADLSLSLLLPNGLDGTRADLLTEEGNAQKAEQIAKDREEVKGTLSALYVAKKVSGHDLLAHLVELGKAVGDAERRRQAAKAAASTAAEASLDPKSTLFQARNRWVQVMTTLLRVLSHAKQPEEAISTVRRTIAEPAVAAAKRAAARKQTADKKKAPAPKPGEGKPQDP